MFEQTFKNIDDLLHKDASCGSELKYLDDLEKEKRAKATLSDNPYANIIAA